MNILTGLKNGITQNDPVELMDSLDALEKIWNGIDSWYWRDRFRELFPSILRILRKWVPMKTFLHLRCKPFFDETGILDLIEESVNDLNTEALGDIIVILGIPMENDQSNLAVQIRRILIQDKNSDIPELLDSIIRSGNIFKPVSRTINTEYSAQKSVLLVEFQPSRESEPVKALRILGQRKDKQARQLLFNYLDELPWGNHNLQATLVLLEILTARKTWKNYEALLNALQKRTAPNTLRLHLLGALAQYSPERALCMAVTDLKKSMSADIRYDYVGWLWNMLMNKRIRTTILESRINPFRQLRSLRTDRWPKPARKAFRELIGIHHDIPDGY